MPFTWTFSLLHSLLSALVSWPSAPLAAAYAGTVSPPCTCVSTLHAATQRTHLVRQQAAKVDDLAAAARHHVLAGRLAEQPARLEVDVEDLRARYDGVGEREGPMRHGDDRAAGGGARGSARAGPRDRRWPRSGSGGR